MGIDYKKCNMCNECYADCGDNYPNQVEGTDKSVCPACMEEWLKKKGIEVTLSGEYECPMYYDDDECVIKKEYNPFEKEEEMISKEEVRKVLNQYDDHDPIVLDDLKKELGLCNMK